MFTYRVKIINPARKKDVVVRDLRQFHGQFRSVLDLRVKLMEEFKEQVPETLHFSAGYFVGRQSSKKWLVSEEDLEYMYSAFREAGKTDICLWCDGRQEEKECNEGNSQKRSKRDSSPIPTSRRAVKEKEIDDLFVELKEMHAGELDLRDPQYRLWARMVVNRIHSSKDVPPNVPMISGVTPRPARRRMEETVASTVAAIMMHHQENPQFRPPPHGSPVRRDVASRLSPSKGVDVRGKCYSQLSCLKQLYYEDSILTTEEFQEQKKSILNTLKTLNEM